MTAKELAVLLNGRAYRAEITLNECAQAKADGLVVVFGASDDLMEFRGAIDDEISAYEGTTAYLTCAGLLQNECENDECPCFMKMKLKASTIRAAWCEDNTYSWQYVTSIPHEQFEIIDDDEKYCLGIVFAMKDAVEA